MFSYGKAFFMVQARGQRKKIGWFPANYVKLLGSSSSARSTPDPNLSLSLVSEEGEEEGLNSLKCMKDCGTTTVLKLGIEKNKSGPETIFT